MHTSPCVLFLSCGCLVSRRRRVTVKREPLSVGCFAQGSQPVRLYLDCFTNIPSFRLIVTLNLTLGMCRLVAVFRYSQTSTRIRQCELYNLLFSDTARPAAALAPAASPTSPTPQSLKILRFLPPPSPASPVRGPTTRTRAPPLILPPTSLKRMRTAIPMPPVLWTWARGVE